jgi:hypothetical protein
MKRHRRSLAAAASAVLTLAPSVALAEGSRPDWAFGEPGAEAGVASFVAAANLTYFLPQREREWPPSSGRSLDPAADDWSDLVGGLGGSLVATGTGYALESGYLASVGADQPGVQALYATMVESESLLLTNAITMVLKRLVGRCRPRTYEDMGCLEYDAFPSGHTSAVSSFAGARIYRLATTDPDAGIALRATSLALAEASTVGVAILRVVAGAHSWEDVLVGAAIGHATGVLVAATHPPVAVDGAASRVVRERRVFVEWGFPF